MKLSNQQIKTLLLGANCLPYDKLEAAYKEAEKIGAPLVDFLPKMNLVSAEQLGSIVSSALKYKYANLRRCKLDEATINQIPEMMARAKGVVAFSSSDDKIQLGMTDPDDLETMYQIEKKTGKKILPFYITEQDLGYALLKYRGSIEKSIKATLAKLSKKDLSPEERDEITIKIVDTLMQFGYESNASDIHIEPHNATVLVRFRIDGVMHDILRIPRQLQDFVLSRIKVLAKMRTDEHRAAQDGKFRFDIFTKDEKVDVRVSIVPAGDGEKIVMRLLTSGNKQYNLKDIGLNDANLVKINRAIANPHGMILVTGPTGSGKTTTVYGVLKILNKREVNITSIEDPVEYDIEGVTQIQVNTKTNLTFASGLRAILRQDPDIIMIGEIRDEETASIAVNSALTGHLVLSTLHTNDAATTLPRLLDMGIEPFLVASTVNIAIGQRLVRQICPSCRASTKISAEQLKIIEHEPKLIEIIKKEGYTDLSKVRFYEGLGCEVCNQTGYTTRIGIFELLEITERIRTLILENASSDAIQAAAKEEGMATMLEDGIKKALMGSTSLVEVLRVTRE
jgi:type IV pilus assembly protein PilB